MYPFIVIIPCFCRGVQIDLFESDLFNYISTSVGYLMPKLEKQ